jgi:hypothetical protein
MGAFFIARKVFMKKSLRIDNSEILGTAKRTEEGFIKADAVLTRTGIFNYMLPNGTVRRELRLPEEVGSKVSLDSLNMVPVTNMHPPERLVTPDTPKIGQTGESARLDGITVLNTMTINDKNGISAFNQGRKQISCGYTCNLDFSPGEWNGQKYDAIQRNIEYNHVAIVDRGRAGEIARINLDAADSEYELAVQHLDSQDDDQNKPIKKGRTMVKLDINGVEYDVAPEVKNAFKDLEKKNDGLNESVKTANSEKDSIQAKCDEAEKNLKEAKEKLEAEVKKDRKDEIQAAVKERMDVEEIAKKVIAAEKLDTALALGTPELKEEVIKAKNPDLKLDEKSDDYKQSRFDSIAETVKAELKNDAENEGISNQRVKTAPILDPSKETKVDAADAREKMIQARQDAWKRDPAKA